MAVPEVSIEDLQKGKKSESSETVRKRVEAAAAIQKERYRGQQVRFNSGLSKDQIQKYCFLGEKEKSLLGQAFKQLGMSARAYYKTIRVARTIADLEGCEDIRECHIAEALGYRMTD